MSRPGMGRGRGQGMSENTKSSRPVAKKDFVNNTRWVRIFDFLFLSLYVGSFSVQSILNKTIVVWYCKRFIFFLIFRTQYQTWLSNEDNVKQKQDWEGTQEKAFTSVLID